MPPPCRSAHDPEPSTGHGTEDAGAPAPTRAQTPHPTREPALFPESQPTPQLAPLLAKTKVSAPRGARTLARLPGPRHFLPWPAPPPSASPVTSPLHPLVFTEARARPERAPTGSAPRPRYSRRCSGQPPGTRRTACIPSGA